MELPDKSVGPKPAGEKKVKAAVVSGAVPVTRPATRRFFDFMFAESPKAVGKKIASDVVMPRVKQGVEEALNSFLSGMLWGGSRPPGMTAGNLMRGGGLNYSTISTGAASSMMKAQQSVEAKRVTYEDLVFPDQQSAEVVLANLFQLMNDYRVVAIGDLNDLVGNTSAPSDNAYGWNNLDGARISKDRNGFRLELPRPALI